MIQVQNFTKFIGLFPCRVVEVTFPAVRLVLLRHLGGNNKKNIFHILRYLFSSLLGERFSRTEEIPWYIHKIKLVTKVKVVHFYHNKRESEAKSMTLT